MDEQPVGQVNLKKELLIAAWFWVCALITGLILVRTIGEMLVPDEVEYRVGVFRISYSAGSEAKLKFTDGFSKNDRQLASIYLIAGALLTSIAWMFHSRRFSLKVYMLAVLMVGGIGLVPQIRLGFQKPPEAVVSYELNVPLTRVQVEALSRKARPSSAFKELQPELQSRLERYSNNVTWTVGASNNIPKIVGVWIHPEEKDALADVQLMANFYAQYIDLLILDLADPDAEDPAYRPAGNETPFDEWSVHWAKSFEEKYLARKAARAAEAASKKEKEVISAP